MKRWLKDWTPLPPDMVVLISSPIVVLLVGIFTATVILHLDRANAVVVLCVALAIGLVGVGLLFWARLPLYRRKVFFSFGPRMLDAGYRLAYVLVGVSVVLMLLLILFLKILNI
jgi:hypothetical protein